MGHLEHIDAGMPVYAADGQRIGSVDEVTSDSIIVSGRRIPRSLITQVVEDGVYLEATGERFAGTGSEQRIPIVEERLDVEKRSGQTGEVRVHREVIEEEQSAPVELRREQAHVEQRDIDDRPLSEAEAAQAFQEGTIRVPVYGEEATVEKEAVVTGEVVVTKEQTTERQEVRDTVRRQRVEVDEDYDRARSGFQQHFRQRGEQGRAFEEVEPRYQWGWQTARDPRYQGREFEEAEPELRRSYETEFQGNDPWEELREDVREAWRRARGG